MMINAVVKRRDHFDLFDDLVLRLRSQLPRRRHGERRVSASYSLFKISDADFGEFYDSVDDFHLEEKSYYNPLRVFSSRCNIATCVPCSTTMN